MLNWLHKSIWQRLPKEPRRRALAYLTAMLAPLPARVRPKAVEPIIVVGNLSTASGLGMGARLCIQALQSAGLDVRGIDLSSRFWPAGRAIDLDLVDATSHTGPGTLIFLINPPVIPLTLMKLGKQLVAQKRLVGYFAWELPRVSLDWIPGLKFVHDIIAPSRFTAQSIQPFVKDEVKILSYPVQSFSVSGTRDFRPNECNILTLTMFNFGSGFERKNPLASIKAFRAAFDKRSDAHLIVKFQNSASFPHEMLQLKEAAAGNARIHLMEEDLDDADLCKLMEDCDILLSLHRSEGFGLTLAEAMLKGKCVVSTGWSGNVDFLSSQSGFPVRYRLIPANDPNGNYHHPDQLWADADVEDAARILKELEDTSLRRKIGNQARAYAHEAFSAEHYAREFCKLMDLHPAGKTST